MTKTKAVFLDRDGTINIDKEYMYKINDFEFILGAVEAIKKMNSLGYKVIVVTNQSGIARGFYLEKDLIYLHDFIQIQLSLNGAVIDAFYYCPHHPEATVEKYRIDCNCRKPKKGLFERAIAEHGIDVKQSWAVGDRLRDVTPANELGISTALVSSDGKREPGYTNIINTYADIYDFVCTEL